MTKVPINLNEKNAKLFRLGDIILESKVKNINNEKLPVYSVSNSVGLKLTTEYFTNVRTSQDTSNYKVVNPGDFVYNPARINVGSIAANNTNQKVLVSPMYVVLQLDTTQITPEYFSLYLSLNRIKNEISGRVESGARFRFTYEMFSKFMIEVPSIEEQNQIASTLDTFIELEAELESELEARKSQFMFFCDYLYSENYLKDCQKKRLSEVGTFIRGRNIQKSDLQESGLPAMHYGEVHTKYNSVTAQTVSFVSKSIWDKTPKASSNDLVLATTSENVEDVCKSVAWLGNVEVAVSADAMIYKHSLDPLYATFFFHSQEFIQHKKRIATGTKVKRISAEKLGEIEICLPSLGKQKFIGETLRELEDLLFDVEIGIPAEIQARRKQYEFYREKLLTFKELK